MPNQLCAGLFEGMQEDTLHIQIKLILATPVLNKKKQGDVYLWGISHLEEHINMIDMSMIL